MARKTQSNLILEVERLRAKGLEEISRLQSLGFDVGEKTISNIENFPHKEKYTAADLRKIKLLTNKNRIRSYASKLTDELQFINYRYKADIPITGEEPIRFRLSYAEVQRGEAVEALIKAAEKLNKDRSYADKAGVNLYYAQKEMEALRFNLAARGQENVIDVKDSSYKEPHYSEMKFNISNLKKVLRTGDPMDENSAFKLIEDSIRALYSAGATTKEGIQAIYDWRAEKSYASRLRNLFEDGLTDEEIEDRIGKIFSFIDASAQSGYIKRNDLDSNQIREMLDYVIPVSAQNTMDIAPRVSKMIINDTPADSIFREFERMLEGDFSNPENLW